MQTNWAAPDGRREMPAYCLGEFLMIQDLRITVLAENTVHHPNLLAEHGLAFWIEADQRKILFDTGQGMVLKHNAEVLGIDLAAADDLVLSHGHFDHTGGLAINGGFTWQAVLYVHPEAFRTRYIRQADRPVRSIGWAGGPVETLRTRFPCMVETPSATLIADSVWVTGQIPRRNDFEDTGGPFYLDEAGTQPDPLDDDQALYIETRRGLVILVGCGHSGVVNTLNHIAQLTHLDRFHAVIGGLHLLDSSEDRVAKSITALLDYHVQIVAPVHCTGLAATAAMRQAWLQGFYQLSTGANLTIQ